jgi:peptidyl-prolyl cis-trans isomerase C
MKKFFHVRHILVKDRHSAEDLIRKLKEGSSFAELARKFSICPSSTNGGDLGPIPFGKADGDFEEAATQLQPDEMTTSPVRTRFGYHIIHKLKK